MTIRDLVQIILERNPELQEDQILEKLAVERERTGGLLGDETLLRLIAAKYGIEVQQNGIHNSGTLSTSRLLSGLNNVTVAGRIVAISSVRTFEGENPGKFATLMLVDDTGVLRVVLWNDNAEFVEQEVLEVGQAVRLLHGYTREDRSGKVELHLGNKSKIEVEPQEKVSDYPTIDKFTTKLGSLSSKSRLVHLFGTVKDVGCLTSFLRSDGSEGKVMRITLLDDSGQVTAVAWNEKASELEKNAKPNSQLLLLNVRVKDGQNSGIEVHVDQNSCVNVQTIELQFTEIADLIENQSVNVQGVVSTTPQSKQVTTNKGEDLKLTVFDLKDDTGTVQVSAWRQHAESLYNLKNGDKLRLENIFVKKGFGNRLVLCTRSGTVASVMPT